MAFSLNEIEAMGKRAARGAGLPWGLAEEAGKAARWLTARGLPGPEGLADILSRIDGRNYEEIAPDSVDGVWRAPSGRLCPLVTGAALCDRAAEIAAGREVELGPTLQPLLLAPYVAGAAELAGTTIGLSWADATMTFSREGVAVEGKRTALTVRSTERVLCHRVERNLGVSRQDETGREVDAETWSRLHAFALRTFAPATESSRLAGAGAGLTDND